MDGLSHNVTEQHLRSFGAIVQWFAQYELTIQRAMAGILRIEVSSVVLLTRDLDFSQKRAALLHLVKERKFSDDCWDRLFAHLAIPSGRVQLRDQIVHATRKTSPEPHSIQPNWILRLPPGIEVAYREPLADDTSYSLDPLSQITTDLAMTINGLLPILSRPVSASNAFSRASNDVITASYFQAQQR
jgi:hypothetical protein